MSHIGGVLEICRDIFGCCNDCEALMVYWSGILDGLLCAEQSSLKRTSVFYALH